MVCYYITGQVHEDRQDEVSIIRKWIGCFYGNIKQDAQECTICQTTSLALCVVALASSAKTSFATPDLVPAIAAALS